MSKKRIHVMIVENQLEYSKAYEVGVYYHSPSRALYVVYDNLPGCLVWAILGEQQAEKLFSAEEDVEPSESSRVTTTIPFDDVLRLISVAKNEGMLSEALKVIS